MKSIKLIIFLILVLISGCSNSNNSHLMENFEVTSKEEMFSGIYELCLLSDDGEYIHVAFDKPGSSNSVYMML